jgi:type VI secretion system protein ImpA
MIDLELLLRPISETQPSGRFLRREPIYDQIQEARREDDALKTGDPPQKLKKSDWAAAYKLCNDALTRETKDLQIAAWMTEALVHLQGWRGLESGVRLLRALQEQFWESVYPPLDEDDGNAEYRARPLSWLSTLDGAIRRIRITPDGYNWIDYQQSREVGYEEDADTSDKQEQREQAIAAHKLTAEQFDKSFYKKGWEFHQGQLEAINSVLAEIALLEELCAVRYGDAAPHFGRLRNSVETVQQVIDTLAEKIKPAEESEPVPEADAEFYAFNPEPVKADSATPVATGGAAAVPARVAQAINTDESAIAAVAEAARFLRRQHPTSPAPFLMLRGLRWGELREGLRSGDPLPAPPTAVRKRLKELSSAGEWQQLLEAVEEAMGGPEGRASLDLQRYAVRACSELGSDYADIEQTLRASVVALVNEFPELPSAELTDGTNAANAETRGWLKEIQPERAAERQSQPPIIAETRRGSQDGDDGELPDVYQAALETALQGRRDEAVRALSKAVQEAGSGRSRFLRRLQLAEVCLRAGVPAVARPVLEDLVAEADARKLGEWEDATMASGPLKLLYQCLVIMNADMARRAELASAICRIDPAGAMDLCD